MNASPRPIVVLTLLCLAMTSATLAAGGGGGGAGQEPYPWQFEQLADGVWAATQPAATRFDESNSLVLVGAAEVAVIDAQADTRAVTSLMEWIAAQFGLPVTTVINTHWHADHTQGNALYRDAFGADLTIIGHESLLADVPERAAAFVHERIEYFDTELPDARDRLQRGVFRDGTPMTAADRQEQTAVLESAAVWLEANRGARFVVPDHTYAERSRQVIAGHTVELIPFGAHTRGDTIVYLPDAGVLASGDVIDDLPYVGHGYPAAWLAALRELRELPFDAIVPGHGAVMRDGVHLQSLIGYFQALSGQVRSAVEAGHDLETTQRQVFLDTWRDRLASDDAARTFFDQIIGEAIERAWLESRGEIE